MYLSSRQTKKEMDKWLKTQPNIITAYKIVRKIYDSDGKYKLVPLYCSYATKKYKKINRIRKDKVAATPFLSPRRPYKLYFHLWLKIPKNKHMDFLDELRLEPSDVSLIECHIPKHLVTALGINNSTPAIVSKGFSIVSEC